MVPLQPLSRTRTPLAPAWRQGAKDGGKGQQPLWTLGLRLSAGIAGLVPCFVTEGAATAFLVLPGAGPARVSHRKLQKRPFAALQAGSPAVAAEAPWKQIVELRPHHIY